MPPPNDAWHRNECCVADIMWIHKSYQNKCRIKLNYVTTCHLDMMIICANSFQIPIMHDKIKGRTQTLCPLTLTLERAPKVLHGTRMIIWIHLISRSNHGRQSNEPDTNMYFHYIHIKDMQKLYVFTVTLTFERAP